MSRQSNAADFYGRQYNNPNAMYDNYSDGEVFPKRAQFIQQRYPTLGKTVVIGCGPGAYLVKALVGLGINAFGFDSLNIGGTFGAAVPLDPSLTTRVLYDVDATNASDVQRIKGRDYADVRGNAKFSLAVTEDLLGCLTTSEQNFLIGYLPSQADNRLHFITCLHPETLGDPPREARLNLNGEANGGWKTQAEWRAQINAAGGTADVCVDTETWEVF